MRRTPSTSSTTSGARTAGDGVERHPRAGRQLDVGVDLGAARRGAVGASALEAAPYEGSHASTSQPHQRHPFHARRARVLADLEPHRDPLGQRLHVGDHADHPVAAGGQVLQRRRHRVQGRRVERAEALVQHDRLQAGRAGGHARPAARTAPAPGPATPGTSRRRTACARRGAARRRGGRRRRTRPCRGRGRTARRTARAGSATRRRPAGPAPPRAATARSCWPAGARPAPWRPGRPARAPARCARSSRGLRRRRSTIRSRRPASARSTADGGGPDGGRPGGRGSPASVNSAAIRGARAAVDRVAPPTAAAAAAPRAPPAGAAASAGRPADQRRPGAGEVVAVGRRRAEPGHRVAGRVEVAPGRAQPLLRGRQRGLRPARASRAARTRAGGASSQRLCSLVELGQLAAAAPPAPGAPASCAVQRRPAARPGCSCWARARSRVRSSSRAAGVALPPRASRPPRRPPARPCRPPRRPAPPTPAGIGRHRGHRLLAHRAGVARRAGARAARPPGRRPAPPA